MKNDEGFLKMSAGQQMWAAAQKFIPRGGLRGAALFDTIKTIKKGGGLSCTFRTII
jgi:hypothetical protein